MWHTFYFTPTYVIMTENITPLILHALGCGCCMLLLPLVLKMATFTTKQLACYAGGKHTASNSSAMCTSHTISHQHISVVTFVGCFGSKPKHGPHIHLTQRLMRILGFTNELFLIECLALDLDGYSARLFCVTLCVKCRLSSCY